MSRTGLVLTEKRAEEVRAALGQALGALEEIDYNAKLLRWSLGKLRGHDRVLELELPEPTGRTRERGE